MVVDGLTFVEPVADEEVKFPGAMEIVVAPLVDQFSVLLEPEAMVEGLAVNELMVGADPAPTVTVVFMVFEPEAFVAVRV